jgi:hypothetical protein
MTERRPTPTGALAAMWEADQARGIDPREIDPAAGPAPSAPPPRLQTEASPDYRAEGVRSPAA